MPIEVAHLDFFQTSVGDERKIASSSYALKLLLATDWLFSPKFQSLPATNKKKLARHEIYIVSVSNVRPSSSDRTLQLGYFLQSKFSYLVIFIYSYNLR